MCVAFFYRSAIFLFLYFYIGVLNDHPLFSFEFTPKSLKFSKILTFNPKSIDFSQKVVIFTNNTSITYRPLFAKCYFLGIILLNAYPLYQILYIKPCKAVLNRAYPMTLITFKRSSHGLVDP